MCSKYVFVYSSKEKSELTLPILNLIEGKLKLFCFSEDIPYNNWLYLFRKKRLTIIICVPIVDGNFEGRIDRAHLSADEVYRIYFPFWKSDIDTYSLVLADLSEKQLLYVDPRVNSSLPHDTRSPIANIEYDLQTNCSIVRDVLARFDLDFYPEDAEGIDGEIRWPCMQYPNFQEGVVYFEPLLDVRDSSIYILHFMDFDMHDVVQIFCSRDIERVRLNLAFNVLTGRFPV